MANSIKLPIWALLSASILFGLFLMAVSVTLWEAVGLYTGGPVRFVVSSFLLGLMVFVIQKPTVTS
jgi:uncharacterized membrane protein